MEPLPVPRDIQGSGRQEEVDQSTPKVDLGSGQSGLETLSLLQTMGELGTWGSSAPTTPQLLPPIQVSIHAAWKRGNQEHPVLSAVLHDR